MSKKRVPVSEQDLETLRSNGRPLFQLGRVVATPAVLRQLEANAIFPAALLSYHQYGEWGNLDDEDCKANDRAILDGSRILSCYLVEGEKIYVITEAKDDAGLRAATTLLFASEY